MCRHYRRWSYYWRKAVSWSRTWGIWKTKRTWSVIFGMWWREGGRPTRVKIRWQPGHCPQNSPLGWGLHTVTLLYNICIVIWCSIDWTIKHKHTLQTLQHTPRQLNFPTLSVDGSHSNSSNFTWTPRSR